MRKILCIILFIVLLTSCTYKANFDSSFNESNSSSTSTLKSFIEKLSFIVIEKSKELDRELGHFFIDNAYFAIFDLDNDNEGELIFGVPTYKTLSIFVFDSQNDEIVCLENSITADDGYKQINLKFYPKNSIIESVYTYLSGTSVANINREFSIITKKEINIIKVITSIENFDTNEIKYYDSNIDGVEITKDEYDKVLKDLLLNDKYQNICLENYIENYLTETKLSDALASAYEKYQN